MEPNERHELEIAVIGMSGRFPGAQNIEKFWQNLCEGVESVSFFTDEEVAEAGIKPELIRDPNYVKAGAILDDPGLFDATFFGYSPREAETIDPQQRLFLECAWEAFENAGYDVERFSGQTGVFAGASRNTYLYNSGVLSEYLANEMTTVIGNDNNFLATTVSYKMNLLGPSLSIQTACSTSLVAVHIACQSLLNHESDMTLAGGTSVRLPQKGGYLYQQGGIRSSDGHCRAFDAKGDGTIFGNGVGVVLLKRLSDAINDGDNILAVIKGSAINNDGHLKVGYSAPSVEGQSAVILEALANAEVEPETVSYIETHGTGTALGDPIEVTALTQAYRQYTDKKQFCAIGSVKTNIGHLDVTAGVAGLIKAVMALQYRKIPASLHFKNPNPQIDFDNSPFYVSTKLVDWTPGGSPLRAGVSSFGIGGTNAHVILEEYHRRESSSESRQKQLVVLSAQTESALESTTANMADFLKDSLETNLGDVAYTLQVGRKAFPQRRIAVCSDIEDAIDILGSPDHKNAVTSYQKSVYRRTAFIFSGQGSQYINMGLELYQSEPVFKGYVDQCAEILLPHIGEDLRDIMYPREENAGEAAGKLVRTRYAQPALFTIEYSLAKLWMSWGINPEAMVGHSIGEYVAACLSGVFTLEDTLSLVAARGKLMDDLPGGAMLAVFLAEKDIDPLLKESLSIAVINGPTLCVVSGENGDIDEIARHLSEKQIGHRRLHTSHAFHSRMMEPIVGEFTERVVQANPKTPQIPFISNVTGNWITHEETTDARYWAKHLRQTVRFSDCLHELLKDTDGLLLEVGPGNTFSTLVKQHPDKTENHVVLSSIRHPKEEKSDTAFILNTLGQIWLAGKQIDWDGFYGSEKRHRLSLPTYPFERQFFWSIPNGVSSLISANITNIPMLEEERDDSETKEERTGISTGDISENVEEKLAEIWKETLGIRNIDYKDNFFDLGGHSLMAVRMFTEIEKVFGKKLPLSTLYQAPSIELLAVFLRGEETGLWSPLVPIQTGDSRPPFFCVHAGGGNVLIFHELSRHLGEDQPFFGLQSQGLDGEQSFLTRIEDMAERYIQEIKTVQPEGPYYLGGFCMGGTIAFEMACQLQAHGDEIAFLTFMETYNWGNRPQTNLGEKLYYNIQRVGFNIGRLFSPEKGFITLRINQAKQRMALLFEALKRKDGFKLAPENGQNSLLYILEHTNDRAADVYVPSGIYQGKIITFVPEKQYKLNLLPELSFKPLATEGVEVHTLPFYRRQMLIEPFVARLASELKECLQQKQEQPAKRQ